MLQDKGMKYTCLTCLIFIAGFPLSSPVIRKPDNSTLGDQRLLSRKKRYLNFPDGSILQLGYCLQVAGLIGSDLIFGYTIGTNWDLPSSVNVQLHRDDKQKADGIHRRHRRDLYAKLEPILTTMGVNGRACILRALCEAGRRKPEKGTFLQEILYSIFTYPSSNDPEEYDEMYHVYDRAHRAIRDCTTLFPECPTSFINPYTPIT
ncbi:uncharacterized protein [Periplaneta americana]|uniref:uncharacterized protein isoform X2 n=1 Tax=Periplaneta americana TaxID=6978 RepID=UPI0037E831C6